jgi:thiol:disulfide interchange protein DsbD
MGAAAAWATTQSPAITLSTFAAIGVGMAFPYLLLSAFPGLAQRMPRAGPASELIKQVMGLLLFAAGAYFLGTGISGMAAKPPDPPTTIYWWFVVGFVVAAGGWLAWRTWRITTRLQWRLIFGILGTLLVVSSVAMGTRLTRGSPIHWTYYTPQRLAEQQRNKKVIVLEFTAAWCLNCHALEQAVLHHPRVVSLLNSPKVAPIKVDLTGNNPEGSKKLSETGRRTIPFLVIYAPDGRAVFSSDAYTVDQIVKALMEAEPETRPGARDLIAAGRFDAHRARLVGGLPRIGIDEGKRQLIGDGVVHRQEHLSGLHRQGHESTRLDSATPRKDRYF